MGSNSIQPRFKGLYRCKSPDIRTLLLPILLGPIRALTVPSNQSLYNKFLISAHVSCTLKMCLTASGKAPWILHGLVVFLVSKKHLAHPQIIIQQQGFKYSSQKLLAGMFQKSEKHQYHQPVCVCMQKSNMCNSAKRHKPRPI